MLKNFVFFLLLSCVVLSNTRDNVATHKVPPICMFMIYLLWQVCEFILDHIWWIRCNPGGIACTLKFVTNTLEIDGPPEVKCHHRDTNRHPSSSGLVSGFVTKLCPFTHLSSWMRSTWLVISPQLLSGVNAKNCCDFPKAAKAVWFSHELLLLEPRLRKYTAIICVPDYADALSWCVFSSWLWHEFEKWFCTTLITFAYLSSPWLLGCFEQINMERMVLSSSISGTGTPDIAQP